MADAAAGAMSGSNKIAIAVSAFAVFVIGVNFYSFSLSTSLSQNADQLKTHMTWITIVNGIFTLFLAMFAYYYISANPSYGSTYFMLISHIALLLSTSALGISVITRG